MPKFDVLAPPGKDMKLKDVDPAECMSMTQEECEAQYLALQDRLGKLQERFRAQGSHSLLVVLQAMDTGGKDGTIKKLFSSVDPQGISVTAFKAPTAEELAHDFLWRIHMKTPPKSQIGIFNRSHYEDVLIARVQKLVPKEVWKARYEQINDFEKLLVENNTIIVKFYLHISKGEQKRRLQARLEDPEKNWKFEGGDLTQRQKWDEYMEAFADAIGKTNTKYAPWHVIPANNKWFRNWAVTKILVDRLEELNPKYPQPNLTGIVVE